VLNAFRHHWNLHGMASVKPFSTSPVLNAFRHHWNLHSTVPVTVHSPAACSTPFGIIGIFTSLPAKTLTMHCAGAQRLSASLESSLGVRRLYKPTA